jgi:hypothetical protein
VLDLGLLRVMSMSNDEKDKNGEISKGFTFGFY